MEQPASPLAVERLAEPMAQPGEGDLYCHSRECGNPESRWSLYCL